jgi:hypothetical protein
MSTLDTLDFKVLFRAGSSEAGASRKGSVSVDFVVNEVSLLGLLAKGGADMMGRFVRGDGAHNQRARESSLSAQADEDCEGRNLLYVCPECGDIGCGAYAVKVEVDGEEVEWSNFAYVNGYEPASALQDVGPFRFRRNDYDAVISKASQV